MTTEEKIAYIVETVSSLPPKAQAELECFTKEVAPEYASVMAYIIERVASLSPKAQVKEVAPVAE